MSTVLHKLCCKLVIEGGRGAKNHKNPVNVVVYERSLIERGILITQHTLYNFVFIHICEVGECLK